MEIAYAANVGIRDTKDRSGGQLSVTAAGWAALVTVAKSGDLWR